jgi:imidazolonepropionase-like amidohydrolase
MKSILFFICLLFLSYSAITQDLIIHDVNYIDVVDGKLKKNKTISITDGKITAINSKGPSSKSATLINGEGKYLIPGLVDAHIHFFQSGGLYTRPDALDLTKYRSYDHEIEWLKNNAGDLLDRYLRCGVTSVIDVGGPMYNYVIRDSFNQVPKKPTIYLTGPLVSTYQPEAFKIMDPPIVKVNSSEEARALVQKQIPFKPDFIKVWYIVLPSQSAESTFDIVKATVDEAHKNNIRVAIHATQLNTAKFAIKAGADILVHGVDNPVDEDFEKMLIENQVVYIPTLMVSSQYGETFAQTPKFTKEDLAISNPIPLGSLMDTKHIKEDVLDQYKNYTNLSSGRSKATMQTNAENLKRLSEKGAIIAMGTDAGNIGTLHGSSIFEEISLMKEAGMSNAAILKASTIDAYKVVQKEKLFGSIEVGKMADLVLLNENPLEDINALKSIAEVFKRGDRIDLPELAQQTPEQLAQQQLNAYNARDIDAFLEPYSEDVKIYGFPNQLQMEGKEAMRKGYANMFENTPDLHCELINRMVNGNTVIDQELVTGFQNGPLKAIAIYKIKNHKIAEVYFIQ